MISIATVKLAAAAVAFVGWTAATWYVSTHLERESWVSAENDKKDSQIKEQGMSQLRSFEAGKNYEATRTALAKRVAPNRKLDELLEGPAGDVLLPGALGMRLNEIMGVVQASAAASQPVGAVP